jgi:hypothetical protein
MPVNQFSTRELLYLEDTGKLFDTINKTCQHALMEVTDPQIKSLISSMNNAHKQWIQSTTSLVTKSSLQ